VSLSEKLKLGLNIKLCEVQDHDHNLNQLS